MTTVSVDPRFRERRIAVRREAGNRRLRRGLLVVALIGVVFGVLIVSRSSWLDVDRIEISGLDRVSMRSVETALGTELGAMLLTFDAGQATAAIEELPWVRTAEVERSWNGTITVEVTERRPVALALTAPATWVLVDEDGRVLSDALENPPPLPRISGVRAAGIPGSFMAADSAAPIAVVEALPPALADLVYGVWRDDRGELRIGLTEGPVILLGGDDRLRAKVAAAATMLDQLAAEGRAPVELDVSVPNLPIIRAEVLPELVPAEGTDGVVPAAAGGSPADAPVERPAETAVESPVEAPAQGAG